MKLSMEPSPAISPLPVAKEVRVRQFQVDENDGRHRISFLRNGVQLTTQSNADSLIVETLIQGVSTRLNIRALYKPAAIFNSSNYHEFAGVKHLELGCAISSIWLFDWVSHLPSLITIRFGFGFLGACDEDPEREIPHSPFVQHVTINFNMPKFQELTNEIKLRMRKKLDNLLFMCAKHFTGLRSVHLELPDTRALQVFLRELPPGTKLNATATKHPKFGVILYKTAQENPDQSPRKRSNSSESQDSPKQVKMEPLVKSFEVIDIASDDDDIDVKPFTSTTTKMSGHSKGAQKPMQK